ncbi:hypothetical protein GTZ85_09955 [Streptomyces sp. SID5474]|nr:hypothetical protein [Streptomyces sp. SID5474]
MREVAGAIPAYFGDARHPQPCELALPEPLVDRPEGGARTSESPRSGGLSSLSSGRLRDAPDSMTRFTFGSTRGGRRSSPTCADGGDARTGGESRSTPVREACPREGSRRFPIRDGYSPSIRDTECPMSELAAAAAEIVPYVSAAAAAMGIQVLASTQQQIADGAVARGRAFLGRLVPGRAGGAERVPAGFEAATRAIAGLSERDRETLELAIGTWLEGRDLGAPALAASIERASRLRAGRGGGAHAYGPGAIAIERVEGDVHGGYRPGPAQGT